MSGDNEELRARFEAASTALEDYLARCEEYASHMLKHHGKGTTWREYAPLMSDAKQRPVVREAANVLFWVQGCREDIAKHGKLARGLI